MKEPIFVQPFEISRLGLATDAMVYIFHPSWMDSQSFYEWFSELKQHRFPDYSRIRDIHMEMEREDKHHFLFFHANIGSLITVPEGTWVTDDRKAAEDFLLKPYRGERLIKELIS